MRSLKPWCLADRLISPLYATVRIPAFLWHRPLCRTDTEMVHRCWHSVEDPQRCALRCRLDVIHSLTVAVHTTSHRCEAVSHRQQPRLVCRVRYSGCLSAWLVLMRSPACPCPMPTVCVQPRSWDPRDCNLRTTHPPARLLLSPPRRLCFHPCLSVCLSVNRITQKLLVKSLRKFVEWLDRI